MLKIIKYFMEKINWMTVSRIFIAFLFVFSGYGMLTNFSGTAGFFASLGIPMASIVLAVVILIKIPGAILYATGKKYYHYAGYVLIAFTVGATLLAHMNWADQNQITQALKNLAIIGGILATLPCARKFSDKM